MPFQAHIELLHILLADRQQIVAGIQGLLDARQKLSAYREDKAALARRVAARA